MDIRKAFKLKKAQSQIQKELEQIFAVVEKKNIRVVVRGDRKIETIEIDGEQQKDLKDALNDAVKEVSKRAEKQMRGKLGDLDFSDF